MDKRRAQNLCFECVLPGHMASSHNKGKKSYKGKGKSVNATGQKTITKEVCATQRVEIINGYMDLEEELETVNDRIEK